MPKIHTSRLWKRAGQALLAASVVAGTVHFLADARTSVKLRLAGYSCTDGARPSLRFSPSILGATVPDRIVCPRGTPVVKSGMPSL